MTAHLGGVPVEEVLTLSMGGLSTCLVLWLTPFGSSLRNPTRLRRGGRTGQERSGV